MRLEFRVSVRVCDEPFPDRSRPIVLTCTNAVSPNHLPVIVASDRL